MGTPFCRVVHTRGGSSLVPGGPGATVEVPRIPYRKAPVMLLAHAVTLAEARSYVAALADNAVTIDASIEYDRVLLQIDFIHGDLIPAIAPVPVTDRDTLFSVAESAIEDLVDHGVDGLTVELVLDMLYAARELDAP